MRKGRRRAASTRQPAPPATRFLRTRTTGYNQQRRPFRTSRNAHPPPPFPPDSLVRSSRPVPRLPIVPGTLSTASHAHLFPPCTLPNPIKPIKNTRHARNSPPPPGRDHPLPPTMMIRGAGKRAYCGLHPVVLEGIKKAKRPQLSEHAVGSERSRAFS